MRKYTRMCGVSLHKKGRGDWGLFLYSHDRNGRSYKRMNVAGQGKFYLGLARVAYSVVICGNNI